MPRLKSPPQIKNSVYYRDKSFWWSRYESTLIQKLKELTCRLRSPSYLLILAPAKTRYWYTSARWKNSWLALYMRCKDKKIRGRRRKRRRKCEKVNKANIRGIRGPKVFRGARAGREWKKHIFDSFASLAFRPVFRVRFVLRFSHFRFALSDPCGDFISFLCFQPSSSSFNSDTVTFLPLRLLALLPCLCLARSPLLFLPFFSRFCRSFLCAYTPPQTWIQFSTSHPAKVTPRRGRKQCDAQLLEWRNGETFLSSLCFYPPLSPFFLLLHAARSKTISEHIAPRFSRSALRARPTAMSSRLFDPRGRRNNAYTTTVAVFPLLVSLVFVLRRPCTVVARFSTRKKSLGKKRVCRGNW